MNFNKKQFTKEEFLDLPVYPGAWGVPVNTDFLLGEEVTKEREDGTFETLTAGSMVGQKDLLLTMLEQITKSNSTEIQKIDPESTLNVRYWRKMKDGHVSERGGHITMKSILESMKKDGITLNLDNLISVDSNAIIEVK